VTSTAIEHGGPGWAVLAVTFLIAGAGTAVLAATAVGRSGCSRGRRGGKIR